MPRVQRSKLANASPETDAPESPKRRYNNGKKRLTGRGETSRTTTRAMRAEMSRNSDPAGTGTDRAIKDKVLSAAVIAPAVGQITRTRAKPKLGENTRADRS